MRGLDAAAAAADRARDEENDVIVMRTFPMGDTLSTTPAEQEEKHHE